MPVSRRTAEGLATDVAAAYARAEVRLLQLIGHHLEAGHDAPDWAEAKLAELQVFRRRASTIMHEATQSAVAGMGQAVNTAYLRGTAVGETELRRAGKNTADLAPRQAEHATEALIRAQQDTLEAMSPRVVRQAADGYRDAVVRASAGTLTGAATRVQDAQAALDDLARQGLTGFTDKAGRQWGLESYVDMATRTTTMQAAVAGHMDRLEQAGINLFMVSNSSRECERCRPWEGKVLARGPVDAIQRNAVTGAMERVTVDGTVDEATRAGLFHPNCTHSLTGYIHGATKRGDVTSSPAGYAEKQEQRRLERGLRDWKRRQAVAITPEAKRAADAKVREWQARIRDHVANTGLPRKAARESFDVRPLPAPRDMLERVNLADLDTDVLEAQVSDLMAAGDFGPRMERLAAELDRRESTPAVLPPNPGGTTEQAFLHDLFDAAPDAEDIAAWARYDATVAEHADQQGYLSGMTVKQQRAEYDTWAHTQWLRAEEDTRGNLLNKRGVHERFDPARFFDGSASPATIRRLASPELMEWFGSNARMSFDEFRAMNGAGGKTMRAARDRFKSRTLGEWG